MRLVFICALVAITGARVVEAQPHKKPPPVPVVPEPPPPPPGPDPVTQARLDEQTAAIAAASAQLAAQQQALAELTARAQALADALAVSQQGHDALAKRLDEEREARLAAEAAAQATPYVRSAWPTVTLSGFLQIDASMRQASSDQVRQSGDPLNQDRFSLRRARPRLAAAYGKVGGVIELDVNTVNGGQVRPSAVEATYQARPWLKVGLGLAKIPFGYEVEQSDKERLFLERSNAERALFPGEYDLGVKVSGAWRFLRYAVALQNGEPVGERGYALRDPNQAKDLSARAGVETRTGDLTVGGGFSFLTGRGLHAGTPATKDVLVWRDLNEDGVVNAGEIQVIGGSPATPSESFDRFAIGADAEVTIDLHQHGVLTAYGELYVAGNLDRASVLADPIATGRDSRELGWYLAAVYAPKPWVVAGARYDRYDPDADSSELRTGVVVPLDQTVDTLSVSGALRSEHGRLILQLDHNRNHAGRTTAGVPTNLADDAITLRAEVQL